MAQIPAIGIQDFEKIREHNIFYVDKTHFIKDWWESRDDITLITRPRRFGKTLNMSMLECFFSVKYAGRSDLFEGLSIWEDEEYHALQGTYPVIALSFAGVKADTYEGAKFQIFMAINSLYDKYPMIEKDPFLLDVQEQRRSTRNGEALQIRDAELAMSLHALTDRLYAYFGKNPLLFLDEYDTPMQEAWVYGFWDETVSLFRNLFNNTFKTNPNLGRAVITGITRVSKESIFSDLNNLKVVTTTVDKYETAFGFTEAEVFAALDMQGLSDRKAEVKSWYDGFIFGSTRDIYNPWSISNYLAERRLTTYWANTSSNSLVGKLIREGSPDVKHIMWDLLKGIPLIVEIDEQIVFDQLGGNEKAIWSLFLASGYLKADSYRWNAKGLNEYTLSITNFEVKLMFEKLIAGWFRETGREQEYNSFVKGLLQGDVEAMNYYMNEVSSAIFSSFDAGNRPSGKSQPERFYHGFVLGLVVDLRKRYVITSNRESGFGRYDVMLEPLQERDPAIVIEFKVYSPSKERTLEDTVASALRQIEEKEYDRALKDKGIASERIRHYGFAFEGKTVLIG